MRKVAAHSLEHTEDPEWMKGRTAEPERPEGVSDGEVAPNTPESKEANECPTPGEVRFYKKHHDIPSRDVMLRISDCTHAAWQGAAGADKAKKGIAHLEGTNEWKTVQHCGTCKGGGVWRVKW